MDIIMVIGGVIFLVLFAFLLFVFVVCFASIFVRRKFPDFEPKVSVVIPAYNEEANIAACIDSVLASGYPKGKLEVIVVDDGSTDRTVPIVRHYHSVRLVKGSHAGKSAALTLGAKSAKHQFVMTIDADTTIDTGCIRQLVRPLFQPKIGATTGISRVKNSASLLGMFQNIEYAYNDLIKTSFSRVFNNGIWFFGALACYRKPALEKIGHFKSTTMSEDMDVALELKLAGYTTYNVSEARSSTIVPGSFRDLYRQRRRWWLGVLQALVKNRRLFSLKSSPSINFLYVNQFWWSFYALISLPLIIYQVNFWLPSNSQSLSSLSGYLFRWFTLLGPFYVIYKIPVWGLSFYSFFGVLSGIISTIMIVASLLIFRNRLRLSNAIPIFLYFPYTICLNLIIFISLFSSKSLKNRFFIK